MYCNFYTGKTTVIRKSFSSVVAVILPPWDATIACSTSAPLYIEKADKVVVTLEGESFLSNTDAFQKADENRIDGVIWSKEDLTFNGSGSLTISSPNGHGIVCKDDLVITGGNFQITSASHALDANDSIRIKDTHMTIDAGKDGIHAEHDEDVSLGYIFLSDTNLSIEAEGDGISASSTLQINSGNYTLLCGGGYENGDAHSSSGWGGFGPRATGTTITDEASTSMKGFKASSGLLISAGTITIDAADDALHSNGVVTINGGLFSLASGDDAVHADTTLTITAGEMDISHSYEGLEAHHVHIKGGNISLVASDDGINAAGGTDASGEGGRDQMFGGGRPGGMPGGMPGGSTNSDGSIVISGGTLYINASGDGIDANGTLEINGGHTTVVGPTQGDTATLDYDVSGIITGGTFIGTGASGMAQSFSDGEQGIIAVSVGAAQAAGTVITLSDSKGNVLLEYAPALSFQVVILSTPEIKSGKTYTLQVGSLSGDFEAQ